MTPSPFPDKAIDWPNFPVPNLVLPSNFPWYPLPEISLKSPSNGHATTTESFRFFTLAQLKD